MNTVTDAVPAEARSVAGMKAFNCVLLRNVVPRSWLFHRMLAPETKLVPLTMTSNPGPPASIEEGHRMVMAGAGLGRATASVNPFVAVAERLSVTRTVKLEVPAAVAIPLMAPLEGVREKPEGREPLITDQV